MKDAFKIGCLGISIMSLILVATIIFTFGNKMCGNRLFETKYSPNKKLKILVFSADCGATTDFSTQISIEHPDYILEQGDFGNVFIADSDHGKAEMNGEILNLKTKWIDNENVLIEYPKNTRIFKNKNSKKGINIIYKQQ